MINFLYAWWSGVLSNLLITPEIFNVLISLFLSLIAGLNGWQSGIIMNFILATMFFIAWSIWGLPTQVAMTWFVFSFILLTFGLFVDKNQGVMPQ